MNTVAQDLTSEEFERILQERADALAREGIGDDETEPRSMFIVVGLGPERYAFDVGAVREVRSLASITDLPAVAPHWVGLTNLRGELVPVLDLARYLGHLPSERTVVADRPIVVVSSDGTTIGLLVDRVMEVRSLRQDEIGPSLVDDAASRRVHTGLTDDLVAILDVPELLSDPQLEVRDDIT